MNCTEERAGITRTRDLTRLVTLSPTGHGRHGHVTPTPAHLLPPVCVVNIRRSFKKWPTLTTQEILGALLSNGTLSYYQLSTSPWVILSDFGAAFAMGAVGGGLWHGIKGARNSPRVRLTLLPDMA